MNTSLADPIPILTDAEREAVAVTLAGVGIIDPRAHADVRATTARLLAAARADERRAGIRWTLYDRGLWCGECDPADDQGCCPIAPSVRAALVTGGDRG